MTNTIFADNAPAYWAADLPVLPLKRWNSPSHGAGKAPVLNEWSQYSSQMPSVAIRDHWLRSYADSNIGLPFGEASGLCGIDIDTDDPRVLEALDEILPASPWVRVGKKGKLLVYRWQGQRNFKLVVMHEGKRRPIVEFLGSGNQAVVPPSIHPETERPYVANCDLFDPEVLAKVQPLGLNIEEELRDALADLGFDITRESRSKPTDVVPMGERDVQLVKHAGYLCRVVLGIDKQAKFTLAEAMDHMHHWVASFMAHAVGDDMDPAKGVAKLLEFLMKDLERGRTLPEGWDIGLSEEQKAHPTIASLFEKNEVQRWTFSKARTWIDEQIGRRPDDDDWAIARIQEIIDKVAADDNFTETEFRVLVQHLERASGRLKMRKTDLLQAFRTAKKASDGEDAADHEAIARQVMDEMCRAGDLRWAQGGFWQWSGSCYKALDDDDVYMHIATSVKGNVLARRHNDYSAIVKTVAKMVRGPLVEDGELGINFANGFLSADGTLHEHSPRFGKTFTMPFNYLPERATEAHKWLAYLESCWGDDIDYGEKVMALQEACAATMFGIAPSLQRAILLHGAPGTGKTQALEVLKALMPANAVGSVPPHLWGERFALTGLIGKNLNICGELPEDTVIQGNVFKEVVEGAEIRTEHKGKDAFSYRPICANWFASNHLPRSRDTSGGFTRRWLILDFNRIVPHEEKVLDFHEVLIAEEREAIAAWAVQGLGRLLANRDYTLPASHKVRINQVLRSNNSVAAFLQSSERVRPAEAGRANAREVFDQYCVFMKETSRGLSVSYERFLQMLGDLGHPAEEVWSKDGVLSYAALGLVMKLERVAA